MTQIAKQPTVIKLNELPEEGQEFLFSDETGELNEALKDIIGKNKYKLKFNIRPIGNAYEMIGEFFTDMDLLCSLCAMDLRQRVSDQFHEIFVVNEPMPRTGKSVKANHSSELIQEGPFCTELDSEVLDIAEFAHEIFALSEPVRPVGSKDCGDNCDNYKKAVAEGWLQTEARPELDPNNPFNILGQLKQ